jgi:hypothetical protein
MRGGIRRKKLTPAERQMYKRPHPTPDSRLPVHVLPREILAAQELLAEVEQGLARVADKPALIVWGEKDPGFKEPPPAAVGAHLLQPPDPHPPRRIALHPGRRPRRDRHRDQGLVARPSRRMTHPSAAEPRPATAPARTAVKTASACPAGPRGASPASGNASKVAVLQRRSLLVSSRAIRARGMAES